MGYTIYTSATPGPYEMEKTAQVVDQVIRPTGLVDPEVSVRPSLGQVDDLVGEIYQRIEVGERVLVTTLTKRMSEDLADYLMELGLKVQYLHSEIDTLERVSILRDLRMGVFDVLVGINLLREGLDLPEVSLVAILDADKQGFLRSATALIQTIGRAARNVNGMVIMYADKVTDAMKKALDETTRRRNIQIAFNEEHGIEPMTIYKEVRDLTESLLSSEGAAMAALAEEEGKYKVSVSAKSLSAKELEQFIDRLEQEMRQAAKDLEFERAAAIRDQIFEMRGQLAEQMKMKPWQKAMFLAGEE